MDGFWTAWAGAEVEGDSEPDMGDEANMGSTIETGGTKRGSEEFESEDLDELLEELKLEVSDEEQINRGQEDASWTLQYRHYPQMTHCNHIYPFHTLKVRGQQIQKTEPLTKG